MFEICSCMLCSKVHTHIRALSDLNAIVLVLGGMVPSACGLMTIPPRASTRAFKSNSVPLLCFIIIATLLV